MGAQQETWSWAEDQSHERATVQQEEAQRIITQPLSLLALQSFHSASSGRPPRSQRGSRQRSASCRPAFQSWVTKGGKQTWKGTWRPSSTFFLLFFSLSGHPSSSSLSPSPFYVHFLNTRVPHGTVLAPLIFFLSSLSLCELAIVKASTSTYKPIFPFSVTPALKSCAHFPLTSSCLMEISIDTSS